MSPSPLITSKLRAAGAATLTAVLAFVWGALGATPAALAAPSTAPGCAAVPATEIKAVLGVSVPAPVATHNGPVLVCTYGTPGKESLVIVRFQTGETTATFTAARKQFDAHGEATKTYGGLGLPAYTSVLGSGGYATSTAVVLKGTTELLVTAPAALTKVVVLVKKLLPAI
jgi:hypothetical protein